MRDIQDPSAEASDTVRNGRAWLRPLLVFAVVVSTLYGVSYQQFRHFDLADPRGASDAQDYTRMAKGEYSGISATHVYRFPVPVLAGWVQDGLSGLMTAGEEREKLSFYVVNFTFMAAAGFVTFHIFAALGFAGPWSLVGTLAFLSSRTTALSTGTPLVDSVYFLALALAVWCGLESRVRTLALLNPLLLFAKETMLPVLFLPLLTRAFRTPRYFASLAGSVALYAWARSYIQSTIGLSGEAREHFSLASVVGRHLAEVGAHLADLATPSGLHDFQNAYSLFLPLAAAGWWLRRRTRAQPWPLWFNLLFPLAVGYSILSGNLGRMLFTAYPVVLAHALWVLAFVFAPRPHKARPSPTL